MSEPNSERDLLVHVRNSLRYAVDELERLRLSRVNHPRLAKTYEALDSIQANLRYDLTTLEAHVGRTRRSRSEQADDDTTAHLLQPPQPRSSSGGCSPGTAAVGEPTRA